MGCRHFRGNLAAEDHDFLVKLLRKYPAPLMLNSWVKLGQIKIPSGRRVDLDKARAVQILGKSKAFCKKERVHVYAVEQGCVFWESKKT